MSGFTTLQLHGGDAPADAHAARATPLYLTAGFVFDDADHAGERFAGGDGGLTYTRYGNPTVEAVERRIAALEGGGGALLLGSGQAALAIALLGLAGAGDRVLSAASIYEGTRGLLLENLPRLGIEADFVEDAGDLAAWEAAIRPGTRAVFVESIPNPKNDLVDLDAIAGLAHRHGLPVVVDNTLATPYLYRPVEHGADVVVHSASKFLAGHGTVLGGVIVDAGRFDWEPERFPQLFAPTRVGGPSPAERHGALAFIGHLRDDVAPRFGPTASPFNAFLIQQGVETLSLRVARSNENAIAIARHLESRPEVHSVDHAGLASSPYHAIARRDFPRGAGSVFSFTLRGGRPAARAFIDAVSLFTRMTHLGDVRSLIPHPASTTHTQRSDDELRRAGIWPGLIRLSVGIEDLPDLLDDLERAFTAVAALERAAPPASARPELTATEP